jgi:phage protein D
MSNHNNYPRPIWQVTLDGKDLTGVMAPRLIELTLSESRSGEADQLDISLSDHDGLLEIPKRNAKIRVALGWSTTGLVDKGEFHVDEIEHRGTPDQLTIRARSAKLDGALRTRTERSFHKKTIGQIVSTVAAANNLESVVDKTISSKIIPHIDQVEESDMAFLNRLGRRYDTVATVKDGKLIFLRITGAKIASGKDAPELNIYRSQGDNHTYTETSRDSYSGVVVYWRDFGNATKQKAVVGVIGNAKHLRETYANEQDALQAARSEWERLRRGEATMDLTLAEGIPHLTPQYVICLPDFKNPINERKWLVKRIAHRLSVSGLMSRLELELCNKAI